jgi:hypothetical protein
MTTAADKAFAAESTTLTQNPFSLNSTMFTLRQAMLGLNFGEGHILSNTHAYFGEAQPLARTTCR